jgi:EAL domain-containing protein (putative c-di-GMP-specific phosphodiesterase class I)
MINAAHAFGMHVVAEGIETGDQLTLVRELGCDSAQGYLLARPQPAESITIGSELAEMQVVKSAPRAELPG